jgi:hypothetical protein
MGYAAKDGAQLERHFPVLADKLKAFGHYENMKNGEIFCENFALKVSIFKTKTYETVVFFLPSHMYILYIHTFRLLC